MGVLYVVGMGPGAKGAMTQDAIAAVEASDLLCGYTAYIELIKEEYPTKEILTTPMKQEVVRCEKALEAASEGRTVAMVCSGDAGIYGMAGLIYELAPKYPKVEIVVVPGVTAAISGAAVLGAPLMNDFCVISLSDLLTPWEVIEKRLHGAGAGDFAHQGAEQESGVAVGAGAAVDREQFHDAGLLPDGRDPPGASIRGKYYKRRRRFLQLSALKKAANRL